VPVNPQFVRIFRACDPIGITGLHAEKSRNSLRLTSAFDAEFRSSG
jgi:hypothetical protein